VTPGAAPAAVADLVVRRALERPATLGRGRLICVDGPAGSGKTTLADAVAAAAARAGTVDLVHMDDVYEGWHGLDDALPRVARDLVEPLRAGRPGRYRRYDWHARRLAETRTVEPVDVLVLEGVGSGAAADPAAITTLVWVEAPRDLRLRRGLERDGEALRAEWLAWMADEERVHAREQTRARADLLVDGTGALPPAPAQPTAGRSST
jgi:uridine kinase